MAKTKERADLGKMEDRLIQLYKLQKIDSKVDDIQILKGELPMEVSDLEDEITGLRTRIGKQEEEMEAMETGIANRKLAIKDAEANIKKYQKQQGNVKNNREYDALSKEIELQKLDIQLSEKKIKDAKDDKAEKAEVIEAAEKVIKQKEKELKQKKSELEEIIAETEAEEKALLKKSKDAQSKIDERLLAAYNRIRKNFRNGMAVAPVMRNSCGGCFNAIPPQMQSEIRQHKKIIQCEHCGRILVDSELA